MIRRLASMAQRQGPVAGAIQAKLSEALKPTSFQLVNESHKVMTEDSMWCNFDYGHQVSRNTETADLSFAFGLRLEMISESFSGLSLVKRHQLVYGLLKDELAAGLHALSMSLKTPAEAGKPTG